MTDNTIITYISAGGSTVFSLDSNYWIHEISGLENHVEITTSQYINQSGECISGQCIKGRTLTFTGDIHGNLEYSRSHLLKCILPGEPAEIHFTTNGKTLVISGYPTKTPGIEPGVAMQTFQFEFFAPYPYFKTIENISYVLAGISGLWQTPFFMENEVWISSFTNDSFVKILNSGTVPQAFTAEIYATAQVTNPVIYNVKNNTFISINKTLQQGDRFKISTHNADKDAGTAIIFTSSAGVSENAFRFITPDSELDMKILPGNNIFMADALENKENMQCIIVTAGGEYHSI